MGCGASNNVVNNDVQPVSNAPVPSTSRSSQRQKQQQQQQQQHQQGGTEQPVVAPQTSTTGKRLFKFFQIVLYLSKTVFYFIAEMSNTMNVLITCDSD